MKVCFLYESVFTLGGIQRCITTLANYLVDKGYDVSVICTNTKVKINREIYGLDKNIKVIYTKKRNILKKIINKSLQFLNKVNYKTGILKNNIKIIDFIYYYSFGKYIQEIVDKEKYDVLICSGVKYIKVGSLIKGNNMIKIGWQHSSFDSYYNSRNKIFWNQDASVKKMFQDLDAYVVLTLDDKMKLKNIKNLDSYVIYNPIGFKQKEKSKLVNKKFIALGRLSKVKGFENLINNFKEFNKVNKEWTLDIYGDGIEKENLEKQINELELNNYIKILPRNNNVKEIYKEASIYCMSSYAEGFPLVILEAMESGLPIITYEMPCINEIFKNRNEGIIIENRDGKKYVEAMFELADSLDKRKKIASRAIERTKDFSIENIGRQWEELFKELEDNKGDVKE